MNANEQEDLLPGLKVLEVATYAAGPTIGAILADFGADVIHLEEREQGDPYRTIVSEHPAVGTYPLLRSPMNFSRTPARFRRRAPNLGEHTAEILAEAGFTPEQVDGYLATGEIRTA
jgi:crotonobetainyl-CoA:carnitine CoA-transferase CaiB-like acyl-CoA transferase